MHKFCRVQKKFLPLAIPKENSERLFEPMFILQRIYSLRCILSLFLVGYALSPMLGFQPKPKEKLKALNYPMF